MDKPPYGRDMKGQLCIAGYREKIEELDNFDSTTGRKLSTRATAPVVDGTEEQLKYRIHLAYDHEQFPVTVR